MKTKNIYIYTKSSEEDYNFRQEDIKKNNINGKNVFTDITFESAYRRDVLQGFGEWDRVRIINMAGREEIYTK